MAQYEYMIITMNAGGRITHLNERLEGMVQEGWHPIMMSGDAQVNVMLRRQRPGVAAQPQAQQPSSGGQ